jgi:hypothetical protein
MKVLKIILATLAVLGGLIYFAIWFTFRTTSEDVSSLKPFSEIIGKELTTKQLCFIAYNNENWVKENSYIVTMKTSKLSSEAIKIQILPVGSALKITDAKRFVDGVTGFKSTYVLGSVYLKEFQKDVQFEYAWGSKNYGTDLKGDYYSYSLAPWQDSRLNIMYDYDQNIEVPYENYNELKLNVSEKELPN